LAIALFRNGKVAGILHPGGITINNFILPGFIVLFFRGIIIENSIVSTFLSNRYMQVLGKASYTFYLLHIGFIESVFDFLRIENLLMVFVLINLISYLIYRFFEEPSQKWLVNWYNKKVSS
jgi:peptidoglycan/LPS O-acetylase OafA/YrhL